MNEAQILYWNREGAAKTFTHPVNLDWLRKHLEPKTRILDFGCGYGRITALLSEQGYQVVGVDAAAAMIEKARHHNCACRIVDVPMVCAWRRQAIVAGRPIVNGGVMRHNDGMNKLPFNW